MLLKTHFKIIAKINMGNIVYFGSGALFWLKISVVRLMLTETVHIIIYISRTYWPISTELYKEHRCIKGI